MLIIIFFLPVNQQVKATKKISLFSTSDILASPLGNYIHSFSLLQFQKTPNKSSISIDTIPK